MAPEDRTPFKKGVSRIYKNLKIKCQPVAINSGNVWPKIGRLNSNKILTISVLDAIDPGIEEEKFLSILQNKIYEELDILN